MGGPVEYERSAGLRDYLAAERTLLAWVRTGLALMGFGFVVARFGLFLQEIQVAQHAPSMGTYGKSLWFGTALIGAGIVVNLVSGWRHARLVDGMRRRQEVHYHSTTLAVVTSFFLALVGLGMAVYLISVGTSAH
jgi:inner membrane protein YidH